MEILRRVTKAPRKSQKLNRHKTNGGSRRGAKEARGGRQGAAAPPRTPRAPLAALRTRVSEERGRRTLDAGPGLAAHGANHSFLVAVLDYWSGLGVSLTNLNFASNGTGGGLRVDAADGDRAMISSRRVKFAGLAAVSLNTCDGGIAE